MNAIKSTEHYKARIKSEINNTLTETNLQAGDKRTGVAEQGSQRLFVVTNVDDVTDLVPPLLAVHGDPAIVIDYALAFECKRKVERVRL